MIICSQLCKLHWHAADELSRVSRGAGPAAPPAMQPSAVLSSPAAAPGSQAAGSPAPAATGAAAALASPPPQQPRPQQRAPQQAPPQVSPTQQRFPVGARSSAVVERDVPRSSPEAEVVASKLMRPSWSLSVLYAVAVRGPWRLLLQLAAHAQRCAGRGARQKGQVGKRLQIAWASLANQEALQRDPAQGPGDGS